MSEAAFLVFRKLFRFSRRIASQFGYPERGPTDRAEPGRTAGNAKRSARKVGPQRTFSGSVAWAMVWLSPAGRIRRRIRDTHLAERRIGCHRATPVRRRPLEFSVMSLGFSAQETVWAAAGPAYPEWESRVRHLYGGRLLLDRNSDPDAQFRAFGRSCGCHT